MIDARVKTRLGLVVPPANPAVEPEMRQLLPEAAAYYVTRLPVFPDTTLYERNALYLKAYADSLFDFGSMKLDAVLIAMTGSSYRLLPDGDEQMCRELSEKISAPVLTASVAIMMVLRALGIERIALVSPYPATLTELAQTYWCAAGFEIVQLHSISEEFKAYVLTEAEIVEALSQIDTSAVQATLLSGTGANTLSPQLELTASKKQLFLSSNSCCAAALWSVSGLEAPDPLKCLFPALFDVSGKTEKKLKAMVENLVAY